MSDSEYAGLSFGFLVSLMVPFMLVTLNYSMFSVVLPAVRDETGILADTAAWLVTAHGLPYVVLMPLYGRLGDGMGKRRLLLGGISLFTLGTFLCLLGTSLPLLVVGRAVQGIGAGGLNTLGFAIITERFPLAVRGKAVGTWMSVGPLASMLGPVIAGLLTVHVGWRSIYWPMLVLCISALVIIRWRIPPLEAPERPRGFLRSFDWIGVALLVLTVSFLVAYLSSRVLTGVSPLLDWRLLSGALLAGAGFVLWERRKRPPFIPLAIFRISTYNLGALAAGLRMYTVASISFLLPLFLTDVYGRGAGYVGTAMFLFALGFFFTLRAGGTLADRWGTRWLVAAGAFTQILTIAFIVAVSGTAPAAWIVGAVVINTTGAGVYMAALDRYAMREVPRELIGGAAGLYSMLRFAGTLIGPVISGVILYAGMEWLPTEVGAYRLSFSSLVVIQVAIVLVGLNLREG